MDFDNIDDAVIEGSQQESKKKGVVDIIFLIDTTGSMGPAISQLAKNISVFVENLDPSTVKDWRVKVYSFGDFESDDPEISFVQRDWVNDHTKVQEQLVECLEIVKKGGGGDEPESSLDALYNTVSSGFDQSHTERTRTLVLFTDASPKQIQNETIDIDADKVQLVAQQVSDQHVYVHMYAPKHDDYNTIKNNASKFVTYNPLDTLEGKSAVESLKTLDFEKVLETLGKSVSQASIIN